MSINGRIKLLRKSLQLNQRDFGNKIGLTQSGVSWMEQEGNTVIEQNIRLLCDTYGVAESWLRDGSGEMYATTPHQENSLEEWAKNLEKNGDTFPHRLVTRLSQMTEEEWKVLENVVDQLVELKSDEVKAVSEQKLRAKLHAQLDAELDAQLASQGKGLQKH